MKILGILALSALFIAGCGEGNSVQEVEMQRSEQLISNLTTKDLNRLEDQRHVIEIYIGNEDSREKYKTGAGKLGLLRALLDQGVFKPEQTYKLQCMGIVLGDVFVQELGMKWIIVEDEYGRDPAVRLDDTSIIAFPLTMISKRVEKGEEVDVFHLFNLVTAEIEELKDEAD